MAVLRTIGYERASLAGLATTLAEDGVARLIDVRAHPHSRRREFAYKHLGPGLRAYGIAYEAWPVLGMPAAGRAAARAGDAAAVTRIYETHLAAEEPAAALTALAELAQVEPVAILCYERDPQRCHRRAIAAHLAAARGLTPRDLFPALGRAKA